MRHADHPHARIALRIAVGRQLFEMGPVAHARSGPGSRVLGAQTGFLGQFTGRGRRQVLVSPHEAAGQRPASLEGLLAPPDHQRAERVAPHGEHDQVDGDGEGRKGRRVVGRHAAIIVVCLTINRALVILGSRNRKPRGAAGPDSAAQLQRIGGLLDHSEAEAADPHGEGFPGNPETGEAELAERGSGSGLRATVPAGASGRIPASAVSTWIPAAAGTAAGRQAAGCGSGALPAVRCSAAYISGRRYPKLSAASSRPLSSAVASFSQPAWASPATATALSYGRTAPDR